MITNAKVLSGVENKHELSTRTDANSVGDVRPQKRSPSTANMAEWLKVSEEVASALKSGRGVVALESTVITHGMPYPKNVETAHELESIVRQEGCVPATVAIADGFIHVGVSNDLMNRLGSAEAKKISRRDLAIALSKQYLGGTTVSATMIAAKMAGIQVFATGGIGGVHRGVERTWDISADLMELGRTPVAVVCAGIKSILDIPKSLEFLETQGVPVITYGPTDNWPGFFSPNSGYKSPYHSADVNEIAKIIDISKKLNLDHGFVIGVPITDKELETGQQLQNAIEQALAEAKNQSISGRDITPFVLKRTNELTSGLSLDANVALIKNNARVASQIAKTLSENRFWSQNGFTTDKRLIIGSKNKKDPEVVVVGGTMVDFYLDTDKSVQSDGSTHVGSVDQACGGVGRNHADALSQLGVNTLFISALGNDQHAQFAESYAPYLKSSAIRKLTNVPTATYAAFTTKGNLNFGISSPLAHDHVTVDWVKQYEHEIRNAKMLIVDANIPKETIAFVCDLACAHSVPIWFDPTDKNAASKICKAGSFDKLACISPNFNEFLVLVQERKLPLDRAKLINPNVSQLSKFLLENAHHFFTSRLVACIITLGAEGVFILHREKGPYEILHYPAPVAAKDIVNVSGAGDCLNSGIIYGLLNNPVSITEAIKMGLLCASASLQSKHPVPRDLGKIIGSISWNVEEQAREK